MAAQYGCELDLPATLPVVERHSLAFQPYSLLGKSWGNPTEHRQIAHLSVPVVGIGTSRSRLLGLSAVESDVEGDEQASRVSRPVICMSLWAVGFATTLSWVVPALVGCSACRRSGS